MTASPIRAPPDGRRKEATPVDRIGNIVLEPGRGYATTEDTKRENCQQMKDSWAQNKHFQGAFTGRNFFMRMTTLCTHKETKGHN